MKCGKILLWNYNYDKVIMLFWGALMEAVSDGDC